MNLPIPTPAEISDFKAIYLRSFGVELTATPTLGRPPRGHFNSSTSARMAYFIYNRKSQEDDARQVQSIGDQRKLNEELVERLGLDVVECLDEAMSAKRPGRPVFSEMLERIERGEATGIIAWHPDRLARNAVDAGRIIDLLDTGRLTDLKFHSYTFENTPEGKWMLQIVLSQSKYFVDKLSKDVGRGMRSKLEKGHFPHRAGPGYLNDRNDRTIAVDPERFPMLRRAIETLLTGAYSVPQVHSILNNDWGYRTRRTRKTGGGPLPLSKFYSFLTNRFITGQMVVKGEVWEGKHQPMVTVQEFEQLQRIIKGASIQPQRYEFDFTGIIRCGVCGCQITADQRVKHYPSTGNTRRYVYYHCTNSKGGCRKVSITEPEIERQIGDLLGRVELSEEFRQWCLRPAKTWFDQETGRDCASLDSLQKRSGARRTAEERTDGGPLVQPGYLHSGRVQITEGDAGQRNQPTEVQHTPGGAEARSRSPDCGEHPRLRSQRTAMFRNWRHENAEADCDADGGKVPSHSGKARNSAPSSARPNLNLQTSRKWL